MAKWSVPLTSAIRFHQNSILVITKKVTLSNFLITGLAAALSYAAYVDDFAVSNWPWRTSLFVACICSLGPFLVYLPTRRTNALRTCGLMAAIGVFAVYYFFGIFGYFFYFGFAPMPGWSRWLGLIGGAALTTYWAAKTHKSVKYTIDHTSFVTSAFADGDDVVSYDIQKGMAKFEKLHKESSPFPKIYAYIVYAIAPFCLVLNRLLGSDFGSTGVFLFIAILGMPLSLWLVALFVRVLLVMIVLPIELERKHHKRVVVTV